jgi:hypothetical protein
MDDMTQPSLDRIFSDLERAKTWARDWALTYPEHERAVDKFVQTIHQLGCALNDGPYDETQFACTTHFDTTIGPSHDVVSLLSVEYWAMELAEAHPAYLFSLYQFRDDFHQAFKGLLLHIDPDMRKLLDL